jgi:hypothetical protein
MRLLNEPPTVEPNWPTAEPPAGADPVGVGRGHYLVMITKT